MQTLAWKRRLGALWGMFARRRPRKVILLYHALGVNPPAVTENCFRQQIGWLVEHASIVPLDVLLKATSADGLQVAITFDDGYASLHDSVAPILKEHGVTATVYLNTGRVGESARKASDASLGHYPNEHFLTWSEVEALAKAGWTIGSHGVEHLDLTRAQIPEVEGELRESKQEIQSRLGGPCKHFAYTWGRFTPALQGMVRSAGYASAVSGLHGPVTSASDRFALPRIDVRAEYELRDFIDVVTGRWDYLGFKQRLARKLA
jgi:peptidoglycan/xylan/chitin deacetylase (PgdA/CDA1 family)